MFYALLHFLEILLSLGVAVYGVVESIHTSNVIQEVESKYLPNFKRVNLIRWQSEQLSELSTRFVETSLQPDNYSHSLTGLFSRNYEITLYRLNKNLQEEVAGQGNLSTKFQELEMLIRQKVDIESNFLSSLNDQDVRTNDFQTLVTSIGNASSTLSQQIYDNLSTKIVHSVDAHKVQIQTSTGVVVILILVNIGKMIVKLKRTRRRIYLLQRTVVGALAAIFAVNIFFTAVEGIASFFLMTQILDKISIVLYTELPLIFHSYNVLIADAVLTGSASLYVRTADPFWSFRYLGVIGSLDKSLAILNELATDKKFAEIINSVNGILIEKETLTLDNVTAGYDAMYGKEYLTNKDIYNFASISSINYHEARIQEALATQKIGINHLILLSVILALGGLSILIMSVFWIGSNVENYLTSKSELTGPLVLRTKGDLQAEVEKNLQI